MRPKARYALRIARRTLIWFALGALTSFAAAMVVAAALGYERYVVTGASMSGSIERGAMLFSERVPVEELRVGDVITYAPPERAGVNELVTHRIVSIRRNDSGGRRFHTRGDANPSRDPWSFTLPGPEQARAVVSIPYAGYPFALLGMRPVRVALIGVPALAIAVLLLAGLWRQAGREASEPTEVTRVRRREAGSEG